jgi:hypothetical protein
MPKKVYARKIAHGEVDECRIERIHITELDREEIRFSWWPNGKFVPQALDVTESHLLDLMASAIKEGVFTQDFLTGLRKLLEGK